MYRKNKDIEKMLFGYAESHKPELKITVPAKIKLSDKRRNNSVFNFNKIAKNAAAVVCILFVIIFSFQMLVFKNNNVTNDASNEIETKTYLPFELKLTKANDVDIQQYAPWVSSCLTYDVYKYSKRDDETSIAIMYYISARYKAENGFAEIKFYIQLTSENYSKVYYFQNIENFDYYNDIKINNSSEYLNGEYVSNAFYEVNDIKYYIDLMSNSNSAFDEFLMEVTK